MPMIAVPAHFDGERICLDEPFDLEPNAKLIVTILPGRESDSEYAAWLHLSSQRLKDAYGENEPEYSSDFDRTAQTSIEKAE